MSDSEDDNFCFYGKALEPYDEDAVPKKKPISVEDQIATDAQGRRRFHGAFTGGFSAGFYNTVGSLEGWRPTEFRSSRSEKAQAKLSKPEDFMDDEDIGEHGIAPQTVKATSDYASNRKRRRQIFSDGPIPGEPVLHTLITGGNETIGYLLMKNMDLKQKSKEPEIPNIEGTKVYGCIMPKPYEIKRNTDTENIIPNIYTEYIKNLKSNTFGLGYEGLDKTNLNLFKSTQLVVKDKDNKKLSISGQAFGVGAFENEDADIYAKDDMTQYDFELTREKKISNQGKKGDTISNSFVLSKIPLLLTQKFPAPVIPHSFSGKHKVRKSRFEPIVEKQVERKDMTATIRAKYIGEEEMTQPKPSTSNESVKSVSPSSSNTVPVVKSEIDISNNMGNYNPNLLLDKFVPASQDENPHDILAEVKKTESEHGTQEMRDAAKLKMFGPLTRIVSDWQPGSLLCKRFNVREPLLDDRIKKNERKKNHIIFEYQKNNEDNISLQPGLKTIKQDPTSPPSSTTISESDLKNNIIEVNKFETQLNSQTLEPNESIVNVNAAMPADPETSTDEKTSTPLDITDKIDVSKNIDLFKAVFLSSSESEAEDEEKKEEDEKNREDMLKENVLNDYLVPKIKNTKEGILSHIKFNPLFRNKNSEPPPAEKGSTMKTESDNPKNTALTVEIEKDPNMYGPALPDQPSTGTGTFTVNVESDDDWVEKDDIDKRKSHKHKKKHRKEKRHKKERKLKYKH